MPSKWDGFLEGLARQMATDAAFWEVTPMAPEAHSKVVERNIGYFMPVLRAKLLPLLEAGDKCARQLNRKGPSREAWDAAREAALKGSTPPNCGLCSHSLQNNLHGFDQNDAVMDGDKLVHSGRCTYCKLCR